MAGHGGEAAAGVGVARPVGALHLGQALDPGGGPSPSLEGAVPADDEVLKRGAGGRGRACARGTAGGAGAGGRAEGQGQAEHRHACHESASKLPRRSTMHKGFLSLDAAMATAGTRSVTLPFLVNNGRLGTTGVPDG